MFGDMVDGFYGASGGEGLGEVVRLIWAIFWWQKKTSPWIAPIAISATTSHDFRDSRDRPPSPEHWPRGQAGA